MSQHAHFSGPKQLSGHPAQEYLIMAKFKKTEFDYTNVMILSNGRYILVGSVYGEEAIVLGMVTEVLEDYGLTPILNLGIKEKAFRYLAKKIQPNIDNSPLTHKSIVVYEPKMHLEVTRFE
jgi:hypothetical protein